MYLYMIPFPAVRVVCWDNSSICCRFGDTSWPQHRSNIDLDSHQKDSEQIQTTFMRAKNFEHL